MTKPRKIRPLAMAVISSLAFFSLRAQAQDLPVGKIIERVVCLKDAGQSYALYLPLNYATDRRWPVIYAFDPAARGMLPVERFKDAAEKIRIHNRWLEQFAQRLRQAARRDHQRHV